MTISDRVREQVRELADGNCEFLHTTRTPGTDVFHVVHQGAGGRKPEADVNQLENLLWACRQCHDLFAGPGMPYQVAAFDRGKGVLALLDREGHRIPDSEVWFHVRGRVAELETVEARVCSLARIEGRVAADLWQLSRGYKLLDPDAKSFSQYASSRGMSSVKVAEAVRAYEFVDALKLTWPEGVTAEKVDLIRRAYDHAEENDYEEIQARLVAAADQSYTDLTRELEVTGNVRVPARWYVSFSTDRDRPVGIWRTSDRQKLMAEVGEDDAVVEVASFRKGLTSKQRTGALLGADGEPYPYRDLDAEVVEIGASER